MSPVDLTVIILTRNEILHIERSIESARRVAREVIVVDSFSTDGTVELARSLGAVVVQNRWVNHASQLNWALDNLSISTDWVMRLDADEYLDDALVSALPRALGDAALDVTAVEVNRNIRFLGRIIRHGGMHPLWVVRLWRRGLARCEQRWMDEHVVLLRGRLQRVAGNIIDDNRNHLSWWASKHNDYASREAVDLLVMCHRGANGGHSRGALNRQASGKRWLKERVYAQIPLGLRPWFYFFYRVVVRAGFLDGHKGLMFHTMQGLWYRLLVDAKIMEVGYVMERDGLGLEAAVLAVLDIDLDSKSDGVVASEQH